MSTPVDLPIHEVILKIMYNADREKPTGLTAEDVLWKIDNPEITERYVRQVLDWLVREQKVKLYLYKYSLDRYEFLEQKSKNEEEGSKEEVEVLTTVGKETFYLKRPRTKNIRGKVFFFLGVFLLSLITYFYSDMIRSNEHRFSIKHNVSSNIVTKKQKRIKKLFFPNEDVDNQMGDISKLFSKQNYNNNNLQNQIINLYKVTDSLQKQYQSKLNIIQENLDRNTNENIKYTNNILFKIILCNILFLLIIVFIFFKGKGLAF